MPRRDPHKPLKTVRLAVTLPHMDNDGTMTCVMTGENPFSKDPLWRWAETWTAEELADGADPVDTLRWLLTIATQDHPRSQDHWQRQVTHGEGWEQLEMFED